MDLINDITREDLKLFVKEADELLQLLDADISRLEAAETSTTLLQEVFRTAHTLNGSSAMVGHCRMAELAKIMESVSGELRQGTPATKHKLIGELRNNLEALKTLKAKLVF
jgi:chemotaxis protein histidine kinase CheA